MPRIYRYVFFLFWKLFPTDSFAPILLMASATINWEILNMKLFHKIYLYKSSKIDMLICTFYSSIVDI